MAIDSSIIITTKNRRDELAVAIRSALSQSVPVEVLVIDDGSTDGTAEMVRAKFSAVRLERSDTSLGYIVQRNHGARMAGGRYLFSIDDDAEFSTPHVVEETLRDFDNPNIAAVAIPYLEPKKADRLMQSPPDGSGTWITDTFVGTAHALRRDLFLSLGGYCEPLFHQGEESDFALRLLDAGYVVRLGRAAPIYHWESPKRDFRRMDFYGPRNSILFQWQNLPRASLPLGLVGTTFNCLRWSLKPSRFWVRLLGVCRGYYDCGRLSRKPVRSETFRLWRKLRRGAVPFSDVVRKLPPMGSELAK